MTVRPIFIVGCPRSGTGLLRDLVRSHPRIAIPPESHFIPRLYRGWGDPRSDAEAEKLAARILSLKTIRRWELQLEPADLASCRSFAEMIDGLFGAFAAAEGKPRWGDKTPHHVAHLPELAKLFPDGRFIHIHRDPRDVALSWSARTFGPGNIYRAARGWRRYVRKGREDGAELGGRCLEVRYETLLERPEETMRTVSGFLGEEFDPAMLRRAPKSVVYGSSGRRHPAEVDPTVASRWRKRMSRADRATVESVAGDLMAELGYELEGLARPISLPRRAWQSSASGAGSIAKRLTRRQLSFADGVLMARAELRSRLRAASE